MSRHKGYAQLYNRKHANKNGTVSFFPSVCSISSASQQHLQTFLDQRLFGDLYASFSIRDQAHLTALALSSGTSSGWLKAILEPVLD